MYYLDTDTLTLAHSGHARVSDQLRRVDPNEVAITVITRIEILQGRFAAVLKASHGEQLVRAQELLQRSDQRLRVLEMIPVDVTASAAFNWLRQNKKLKKIGRGDLLIASIALAPQPTLVTRNVKDFRQIPGLRVENWAG